MGGERDSEDGTQEAFDDVVCFHDVSFFDDLSVVVLEDGCPRAWSLTWSMPGHDGGR
jgi:hypothetical protein